VLAEELEPMQFDIRTEDSDQTGMVRMRFSYMAPKFQEGSKERLQIMKANNAYLIVTRAGRQIDLIKQTQYGKEDHNITLINYDRNWAIELDFDPVLDKEFGITVNKQQVTLSESVWQVLANHGIPTIVKQLRKRGDVARESLKAAKLREETEGQERESESTMREAEKFVRRQQKPSVEKEQKATEKVVKEAEKEAEKGGRPVEQLVRELIAKVEKHPYKIEFDSHPSAPFFRPEQWGAQKRIYINTAHRFFSDVYNGPDATPRMQAALELLLFVLGVCELDAIGEGQHFYENERIEWSKQLNSVLTLLDKKDPVIHAKSAKTEDYETALGIVPTDKTDSVSPSSLS
jgi:hypothetical protein